jgi:hypothetical protein
MYAGSEWTIGHRNDVSSSKPALQTCKEDLSSIVYDRVARWYICIPKIPILVLFEGLVLVYLLPLSVFYGLFVVIWHIFSSFGVLYQEFYNCITIDNCYRM